jgi:C-terminal processing protease CtpA/Prc
MLSAASVCSFQNQEIPARLFNEKGLLRQKTVKFQRGVSASPSHSEFSDSSLSDALSTVTSAAKDTISKAVVDEPDADEAEIALKKKRVKNRMKIYKVSLPLASTYIEGNSKLLSIGLNLCQINKGRVFDRLNLNMDTLKFEEIASSQNIEAIELMDEQGLSRRVDSKFQGIVVSSVVKGSSAWTAGVRAGDILHATSATMGNKLWPKSTLEGVRSVMQSRKAISASMEIEFQRLGDAVDDQFELTLTRPIGLQLKGETHFILILL